MAPGENEFDISAPWEVPDVPPRNRLRTLLKAIRDNPRDKGVFDFHCRS